MPVSAYKQYSLHSPETHWRVGRCEEVVCEAYQNGWITKLDVGTELGQKQYAYITNHSGRRYTERAYNYEGPSIVEFHFEAGQQCFAQHRVPLERDPILVVRDGDFRGNPTGRRHVHSRVDDWVDDFANHQIIIAERFNRG